MATTVCFSFAACAGLRDAPLAHAVLISFSCLREDDVFVVFAFAHNLLQRSGMHSTYQLKTGCAPYFSTMLTDCFSAINDGYRPTNDYIHHLLGLLLPTDNVVCTTYAFHPAILKRFERYVLGKFGSTAPYGIRIHTCIKFI